MRIAINGMGRIGRLLFRRLVNHPSLELVAVNDIMPTDNLAYLIRYDSVYGTYPDPIVSAGNQLEVNGKNIAAYNAEHPSKLPWAALGIDVVLECSGKFSTEAGAREHLESGASKVLLSTTGSTEIPLMIYGFNHSSIHTGSDIVSPGGCMTNCSVHVINILNAIGINTIQLNILHSYTSRQELVDAPHPQFIRGRAAAESIIPVEIDLAQSLERVLPGMKNKIAAVSTRVPVANGAMADFTAQLNRPATKEEVNTLFRTAAEGESGGVVGYTEEPLVSLDYKGNTHSCVIDGHLTTVIGNQVKVIAWFDNEYGFTSRMIDWLQYWKGHIG